MHIQTKKQYLAPNYKRIFNKPPFLVSKDFSVWIEPHNGAHAVRLGVVVAKKNVKMAVVRNKSKRIAKELFKHYQHQFIATDIVIVIKKVEVAHNLQIWKKRLAGVYLWLGHFVAYL